jgi:hypothetical protein
MNIQNIATNVPIFTIFVLILIISANFLAQLFPCRFQHELNNNMYLKHFFSFLTMVFFVVLSSPIKNKKIKVIVVQSIFLYIAFLFLIKTDYRIFILLLVLLSVSYLFVLKKVELEADKEEFKENQEKLKELDDEIKNVDFYNFVTMIVIVIFVIIGFLSYLGQKKLEYKNNFDFNKFLFGKPSCKNKSPSVSIFKGIYHALD